MILYKIFKISLFCFFLFVVNASFVFADDCLSIKEAASNAEKVLEINSRLVRGSTWPLYCKDGLLNTPLNWMKSCPEKRDVSVDEYKEFFHNVLETEKQFQLAAKDENNACSFSQQLSNGWSSFWGSVNAREPGIITNFLNAYYDKIVFYSDETDCEVLERMNYLRESYSKEFNDCLRAWCVDRKKFDVFISKVKETCPSLVNSWEKMCFEPEEIGSILSKITFGTETRREVPPVIVDIPEVTFVVDKHDYAYLLQISNEMNPIAVGPERLNYISSNSSFDRPIIDQTVEKYPEISLEAISNSPSVISFGPDKLNYVESVADVPHPDVKFDITKAKEVALSSILQAPNPQSFSVLLKTVSDSSSVDRPKVAQTVKEHPEVSLDGISNSPVVIFFGPNELRHVESPSDVSTPVINTDVSKAEEVALLPISQKPNPQDFEVTLKTVSDSSSVDRPKVAQTVKERPEVSLDGISNSPVVIFFGPNELRHVESPSDVSTPVINTDVSKAEEVVLSPISQTPNPQDFGVSLKTVSDSSSVDRPKVAQTVKEHPKVYLDDISSVPLPIFFGPDELNYVDSPVDVPHPVVNIDIPKAEVVALSPISQTPNSQPFDVLLKTVPDLSPVDRPKVAQTVKEHPEVSLDGFSTSPVPISFGPEKLKHVDSPADVPHPDVKFDITKAEEVALLPISQTPNSQPFDVLLKTVPDLSSVDRPIIDQTVEKHPEVTLEEISTSPAPISFGPDKLNYVDAVDLQIEEPEIEQKIDAINFNISDDALDIPYDDVKCGLETEAYSKELCIDASRKVQEAQALSSQNKFKETINLLLHSKYSAANLFALALECDPANTTAQQGFEDCLNDWLYISEMILELGIKSKRTKNMNRAKSIFELIIEEDKKLNFEEWKKNQLLSYIDWDFYVDWWHDTLDDVSVHFSAM